MNKSIYIILAWLLLMWACDPCDDCGKPLVYDPSVTIVFINQDSIDLINDSIAINNDSIKRIDTARLQVADTLRTLSDTIDALDKLIASGSTEYEDDKERFEFQYDSIGVVSDTLDLHKSQVSKINSGLSSIITTIKKGSVQLSEVLLTTSETLIPFPDSMKTFKFPLLIGEVGTSQETSYRIVIVDDTIYLSMVYSTYETVDAARVARIRARNIDTLNVSEKDSLTINCRTDDCLSDETTFTIYF